MAYQHHNINLQKSLAGNNRTTFVKKKENIMLYLNVVLMFVSRYFMYLHNNQLANAYLKTDSTSNKKKKTYRINKPF